MNTKPIAFLALITMFIGRRFLDGELYLYLVFATLALLIITVVRKISIEKKQSEFILSRYIPGLIGIVCSIGIFFYYILKV